MGLKEEAVNTFLDRWDQGDGTITKVRYDLLRLDFMAEDSYAEFHETRGRVFAVLANMRTGLVGWTDLFPDRDMTWLLDAMLWLAYGPEDGDNKSYFLSPKSLLAFLRDWGYDLEVLYGNAD